jgi:sterol desaturase/sphingolipid hydroxylase (fatty acid hydroxylase superfamily)
MTLELTYDIRAGLVLFFVIVFLSKLGYWLAFRVPALARMRELNRAEDALRIAKEKYPPVIRQNRQIGLAFYAVFFVAIAPFCVSLAPQPLWQALLDGFLILMVYDFVYYLTHRFVFHGPLLLKVHGLHHQARDPSHIDAFYVHPVETVIGILLFMGTIVGLYFALGTFHALTVAVCYVIFVQLNTINHTRVELPYFPFRTLTWITKKHHVHHENMQMGNYATITLLFDWMFGTLD